MRLLVRALWWSLLLSSSVWAASPLIVIDPGHGGSQDGVSSAAGFKEKDLALLLAKKVKLELEKELRARVKLTREKDSLVHLNERVEWANQQHPALFLSIHANSMPTRKLRLSTLGLETYFLSANASGDAARKVAARENAESPKAGKTGSGDTLSFILADL